MKEMKQEMKVVSTVILLLALVCGMMAPGFAVQEARATTLVNIDDVRARENAIPGEEARLRAEKAGIRRILRGKVAKPAERRRLRRRNMEIFNRLRQLNIELRRVRRCRRALEYANNQGFPYPAVQPGESREELEARIREYIRSTLFRIDNVKRAIQAAKESGAQADGIRKNLENRLALLKELLKKARLDRRKVQNGEILIPPAAPKNPNGGGNAENGGENGAGNGGEKEQEKGNEEEQENENVQYFPGEGYIATLSVDQIRVSFDQELPTYVVQNPFDYTLLVTVEITDDDSNSLASREFALAAGSALDVSSLTAGMANPEQATVIYFLSEPIE
jgi:hypothetical protein